MTAPETNTSVILATARARVDEVLSAYKGALGRKPTPADAASITATIEPLTRAVAALSQAVAASVGYTLAAGAPLDDSALAEARKQPRREPRA